MLVTVQISCSCKTTAGYHCLHLIFYVYLIKLHCNECILFTLGVVFAGRMGCSVNVLYMDLSYTGSLDRSTRASQHITVQISLPVRLPGWQVIIIVGSSGMGILSLLCMWSLLVDWFIL